MSYDTPHEPCKPFSGRTSDYQTEIIPLWMSQTGKRLALAEYLVPKCETELCMTVEHLEVLRPTRIDYPYSVCVYCGEDATTKDHLLPRSWTGEAERRIAIWVPACRECNSAINAAFAPSMTMRRDIAHKFIAKRYAAALRTLDRTPSELREFGKSLRAQIVKGMAEKKRTQARLSWPPAGFDSEAFERSGIDPYAAELLHDL